MSFQKVAEDLERLIDDNVEKTAALTLEASRPTEQARLERIRFDNTIRLWTVVPTYAVCLILWLAGVLPTILPMTVVTGTFCAIQFIGCWLFLTERHARKLDFFLCSVDLAAMSAAVYFSGGIDSPLYFIYFVPIIVHAFHRDWDLIVFNGFGGVFMYAVVITGSFSGEMSFQLLSLGARLFFMLLTVAIAAIAVNLLLKKEAADGKRLVQVKMLARITQKLNLVSSPSEVPAAIQEVASQLNSEWGENHWFRGLLLEENRHQLKSYGNTEHVHPELKQQIDAGDCPAFKGNKPFSLTDASKGEPCPTERFLAGSHICFPISSSDNRPFGILFAGSSIPNAFSAEELKFLGFVARTIGLTIQRLDVLDELRRIIEMDSCATAVFMNSTRGSDAIATAILEGVLTILKADQASLMLWDKPRGLLSSTKVIGPWAIQEMNLTYHWGEGIPGKVLEAGAPSWTTDVSMDPHYKDSKIPVKVFASLPLRTFRGEPLGVVNVVRLNQRNPFSTMEIDVASTFTIRAAAAVEIMLLYEKQKSLINQIDQPNPQSKAA